MGEGEDKGGKADASTPKPAATNAPKESPDKGKAKEKEQQSAGAGQQDQEAPVVAKASEAKSRQRNVVFKVPTEKKPIWSEIKIQNPSNDQKTFKVKCTSAELFRVQPPLGFIKPNDTSRIRLWFQNTNGTPTDGKKHYFAIYFMNAEPGKTVKELWSKDAKHEGICRINVVFVKKEEGDEKSKQPPGEGGGGGEAKT